MDRETLAAAIDHTVLGPETTRTDVRRVLREAATHGMNACVPPCYLDETEREPDVTACTVVGFPHGQHSPATKATEAERAWRAGADEIDLVCNVGRLRAGEFDAVRDDVERVVAAVPVPTKVIVEAGLLDEGRLHSACKLAKEAGADYVKTSTGFAGGPAAVADVELMSEYLPVKASGGVGDYERAVRLFEAGAERIGASSGVAIVEGHPD